MSHGFFAHAAQLQSTLDADLPFYSALCTLSTRWRLRHSGKALMVELDYSSVGGMRNAEYDCELVRAGKVFALQLYVVILCFHLFCKCAF